MNIMFYFMLCSWLDGDDPEDYKNSYTFDICAFTYVRNRIYCSGRYIAGCLDW